MQEVGRRKTAVEECMVRLCGLGIGDLVRCGVSGRGRTPDGFDLRVEAVDGNSATIRVNYSVPGESGVQLHRETTLPVEQMRCGCTQRWLLVCPDCERPCTELFIGSSWSMAWSCRICLDLSYRSQQTRVVDFNTAFLLEEELLGRLARCRSSERADRLWSRIRKLSARRQRAMVRPVREMVSILESVARKHSGGVTC